MKIVRAASLGSNFTGSCYNKKRVANIFSNITEKRTSGNIINTISDHLGQFIIIPKLLLLLQLQKRNLAKEL